MIVLLGEHYSLGEIIASLFLVAALALTLVLFIGSVATARSSPNNMTKTVRQRAAKPLGETGGLVLSKSLSWLNAFGSSLVAAKLLARIFIVLRAANCAGVSYGDCKQAAR